MDKVTLTKRYPCLYSLLTNATQKDYIDQLNKSTLLGSLIQFSAVPLGLWKLRLIDPRPNLLHYIPKHSLIIGITVASARGVWMTSYSYLIFLSPMILLLLWDYTVIKCV